MAGANPNPTYITAAMWWLWDYVDEAEEYGGVRLGGIYANKPGNHNTVNANLARWPSNYSVRNPIDRRDPRNKARAIDFTMNDAGMRLMTGRLVDGVKRNDPRLRFVKEFYGSLDGRTVVGRIKDDEDGPWKSASADSSHTWHVHAAFHTPYVDDMEAMRAFASLISGQSLAAYIGGTVERNIAEYGDTGTWVGLCQRYLKADGAKLAVDQIYGNETTAAAKWWFVNVAKGTGSYSGRYISSWIFKEFIRREAAAIAKAAADAVKPPPAPAPTQAQVDAAVTKFLTANPVKTPTKVTIDFPAVTGTVTGSQ